MISQGPAQPVRPEPEDPPPAGVREPRRPKPTNGGPGAERVHTAAQELQEVR